jgi:hypothetical protein
VPGFRACLGARLYSRLHRHVGQIYAVKATADGKERAACFAKG